jgi:hypothetical protein
LAAKKETATSPEAAAPANANDEGLLPTDRAATDVEMLRAVLFTDWLRAARVLAQRATILEDIMMLGTVLHCTNWLLSETSREIYCKDRNMYVGSS